MLRRPAKQVVRQVKAAVKRHKPDNVIWVERLDVRQSAADLQAGMRAFTEALGPGVWCNTLVAFTHCGGPMPRGPNGQPMSWQARALPRFTCCTEMLQYRTTGIKTQ